MGVLAGIGQILDTPGLDRHRESLSLSWWSKENGALIRPIPRISGILYFIDSCKKCGRM